MKLKQILFVLCLLPIILTAQTTGLDIYGNECYCEPPSSYEYSYVPIVSKERTCKEPVFNTRIASFEIRRYYIRVAIISKNNTAGYYEGLEREDVPLVTKRDPNKYDQVRTYKTTNLDEALWLKKEMERIGYCNPTLVSELITVKRYY